MMTASIGKLNLGLEFAIFEWIFHGALNDTPSNTILYRKHRVRERRKQFRRIFVLIKHFLSCLHIFVWKY